MRSIRYSLPLVALITTLALYWLLHQTIVISNAKRLSTISMGDIDFIRVLNDSKVDRKERKKKEIPKKVVKKPPRIDTSFKQTKVNLNQKQLDISMPDINLPVNVSGDFLSGASFGLNVNSEATPILRIPPIYPRRARMLKKEGYVKLRLFISKDGLVHKAVVIDAKPKNIFNQAALNSVYDWKFKPKLVDGNPIEQIAEQVVEFKLR